MSQPTRQTRIEEQDIQEIKPEPSSGYEASQHGLGELVELESGQELDYGEQESYPSTGEAGYEDQGVATAGYAEQTGKSS